MEQLAASKYPALNALKLAYNTVKVFSMLGKWINCVTDILLCYKVFFNKNMVITLKDFFVWLFQCFLILNKSS